MMANHTNNTRRSFLNRLLGGAAALLTAAIGYPIIRYLRPPETRAAVGLQTVEAGKIGELKLNSGKIFPIGTKPGILIRTPKGEYRAFTAICTHLGCTVQYRSDMAHIWCACHNGMYDLFGRNISGPPPRPLKEYPVKIRNGKIYAQINS